MKQRNPAVDTVVRSWVRGMRLRHLLVYGFAMVIAFLGILVFVLEATVVSRATVEQAQQKVRNDLNTARAVLQWKTESVRAAARFAADRTFVLAALRGTSNVSAVERLDQMRRDERLDILTVVDARGRVILRSRNPRIAGTVRTGDPIVWRALHEGRLVAGLMLEPYEELAREGNDLAARALVRPNGVPNSTQAVQGVSVSSGMLIKAAAPVFDGSGRLLGVAYAAVMLNNDEELVDRIKATVYQDLRFRDRDIGTSTVFLGDWRIATNVTLKSGARAVGTRMADDVRARVLERGQPWVDRALVVDRWFLSAYEPLRDPDGVIIGALYVGMLEEPFIARRNTILLQFGGIIVVALLGAFLVSIVLASVLAKPIDRLRVAVTQVAAGNFSGRIDGLILSAELDELVAGFNRMSSELEHMMGELKSANAQLTETNRTYMELLGIVSHEFKGALSSLIMNACSVRDGYLGPVTPRQRRALDSIEMTLDRLTEMVRHYLDLSRLEKDELAMRPAKIDLCDQVILPSIEVYRKTPAGTRLRWEVQVPEVCPIYGDRVLLSTVMDNLLSNAVKYASEGGVVRVSCEQTGESATVRVFNSGTPIPADKIPMLFRKFSRLHSDEERRARGTGLGLYIAAQIITRHAGVMRYEPSPEGNTFLFTVPAGGGEEPAGRAGCHPGGAS